MRSWHGSKRNMREALAFAGWEWSFYARTNERRITMMSLEAIHRFDIKTAVGRPKGLALMFPVMPMRSITRFRRFRFRTSAALSRMVGNEPTKRGSWIRPATGMTGNRP